jgi:hypothetical protein
MITLSDLNRMSALSRLFVALEWTQSGAAGGQRIGTTPVQLLDSVLFCHLVLCGQDEACCGVSS